MSQKTTKTGRRMRAWLSAGTIAASVAMAALVPINMGGCASSGGGMNLGSVGGMLGNAVGGDTGKLIGAGSKAANAGLMNEAQEPAMGQSVAVAVTNRYGLDSNVALNKYVTLVGLTVAYATPRADSEFVFGVLDTDEVNAFAGPGGYIMVTRGAVRQCRDESELAGVLAHEVAHVVEKHGLKAMKQAGVLEGLGEAAKTNDTVAQWGVATDGIVDIVLKKGYSREQEGEADLAAVDYLIGSGYDPHGYQHFLERMAAGSASAGGKALMSTHPGLGDRANKVANKIKARGNPGGATLVDRFARNVPKGAA